MYKEEKLKKVVEECYKRIFEASNPPADHDELVKKHEDGHDPYWFLNYEIDKGVMDGIIEDVSNEYKIKDKRSRQLVKNTIYLGYSPTFS